MTDDHARDSEDRLRTIGGNVPVRLEIPAIDVRADVVPVGARPERALESPAPSGNAPVAWYRESPAPGETGSAVIVGHVEAAHDGPPAFSRLRLLRPGDEILVGRADGVSVRFVVTGVALYPTKAFPNERVYGPREHPELTLVTYGGGFDRNRLSYTTNLIVYARSVPR